MNYALRAGAGHFVLASTGSVYVAQPGPIPETGATTPSSFYAASKLASELLLQPMAGDVGVIVARPFFLYGPGQKDKLVTRLVDRIRRGAPIILDGNEGLSLTPTYSCDVARAFRLGVEQGWTGTFNIASPHVVSLRQLSLVLGDIVKSVPNFEHVAPRSQGGIVPDLAELSKRMDITTFVTPSEGLRRTLGEDSACPELQ